MRLKSYFANDVAAALGQARSELGPDAMLIQSRRTGPEARHLGEFEVVAAVAPTAVAPADAAAPNQAPPEPLREPALSTLTTEVAGLGRRLEQLAIAVRRTAALGYERSAPAVELSAAFAQLVENEVDADLAHAILNRLRAAGAPEHPGELDRALAAEIRRRLKCEPRLGRDGARPAVVALVGPSGAGKTTALVKLAVQSGLTARRPTQILSMDNYRVAGYEQLRSYAAILGVGFQALETAGGLAQALEEHRQKDLILIDTPGFGPRDIEDATELAGFFRSRPDIEIHLVLTAAMKSADLSRAVDRFEIFAPRKLLFTRLDETESFGPLLNEPARTGKSLSFLAAGQRIPEDLEPAEIERVLDLVLRRERPGRESGSQSQQGSSSQ